jgi:hypothetical protein
MNLAAMYIDGLKRALAVDRDEDLAAKVGVAKSTVATWRRRGSIPDTAIPQLEALSGVKFGEVRTRFYSSGAAIRLLAKMAFYKTVVGMVAKAAEQDRGLLAVSLATEDDHIIDLIAERMAAALPDTVTEQEIVTLAARMDLRPDRYVSEDEIGRLLGEESAN